MTFSNKSILTSLLVVGALVLALVLYPVEAGFGFQLLRGLVLVGVLVVILLITYSRYQERPRENQEESAASIQLEEKAFLNELKSHFKELIDSVFRAVKAIHPDYVTGIYMIDPDQKGFTLQEATRPLFRKFVSGHNDILNSILNTEDVLLLQESDLREKWNLIFEPQTWRGSECLMGVRILYKQTPIGCILTTIDHFSKIDSRDRELLKNMGEFFSLGMSKIEKIEQLLSDNYYHSRIASLFDVLEITSNEKDLFEMVLRMCRSFFSYDKLTIATLDPYENNLLIRSVDGVDSDIQVGKTVPLDHSMAGLILQESKTVLTANRSQEFPGMTRFGKEIPEEDEFQVLLGIPITGRKRNLGLIMMERKGHRPFSLSDRHLMELMGATIGSILNWIDEYQRMKRSSIHDGLTGLLNHNALMDRFHEEIERAVRFNHRLVTIVLDLDKFKRLNDTYGHLFGDQVLKAVSMIMKNNVRNIDVVARYGGEEFVIILVNTTVETSLPVAQRIITKISEYPFEKDGESIRVTISAGMAEFPRHSDQVRSLIEKADQAMYQSKAKGGNQVTIFQEEKPAAVGTK
ncbi:MAG: sensor domain-containing diguanylate cyclase [Candidatus Neomarinimicrobiota bacterium]|nr:MAG: sensor domain-containing diguanylate cyclase [Candidatus Neomarinimicrobiota bacterium]